MNPDQFSKTIVLANGSFPKHQIPLEILKNASVIVCCDGAADVLIDHGITPARIIGDMDSISDINREKYKDIIIVNKGQDSNDQTKAVEYCISQGYSDLTILGATGKREDHTIGNISLLSQYGKFINIKTVCDYGVFVPIFKSTTFDSFRGQQVSIFSLTPDLKISSKNLKYPLHNLRLKSWWMGTLNECSGDSFSLAFDTGELIVFLAFDG